MGDQTSPILWSYRDFDLSVKLVGAWLHNTTPKHGTWMTKRFMTNAHF